MENSETSFLGGGGQASGDQCIGSISAVPSTFLTASGEITFIVF
jgi:hypothetical protein